MLLLKAPWLASCWMDTPTSAMDTPRIAALKSVACATEKVFDKPSSAAVAAECNALSSGLPASCRL